MANRSRLVLALAALYVIWGTTYLVIKWAVGDGGIPPMTMAALRFIFPGLALVAWTASRGAPRITRAMVGRAFLLGGLMLAIGNGAVTLAETRMPSGIAALLVATVPLWAAVWERVFEGGKPTPWTLAGLALGLAGVALLSQERGGWIGGVEPLYVLAIVLGSSAWALGSILSRRGTPPVNFWQDLGLQMIAGSIVLAGLAVYRNEWSGFDVTAVGGRAWLSVAYLSIFGSVVALGAFLWLLRNTTPAVATTYAFVNPVVAVAAGSIVDKEPFTSVVFGAAVLIVAAVVAILWDKAHRPKPA